MDCPYLNYVYPEITENTVDVSQVNCFDQSIQHHEILLDVVVVDKMYQKAWDATRNGN
jgi:hypothetical protein